MSDGTGEPRLLLSLRDVSVSYWLKRGILRRKRHYALRNVSFELSAGDSLGVVGRNGSGKSTLLGLLAGAMTPDTGAIVRHGDIRTSLLSLQLGFVEYLSGRENAILSGMFLGMNKHDVEQRLDVIAEFSELGDFMDQPLTTYSSGMRARLGFAVAFQLDPDILLVDEVLGVGDVEFQEKTYNSMRERLCSKSSTVVFVSHSAMQVRRLCNRAIWLEDGRVKAMGEPDQVVDSYESELAEKQRERAAAQADANIPLFIRERGKAKVYSIHEGRMTVVQSFQELRAMGGRSENVSVLNEDDFHDFQVKYPMDPPPSS